MSNACDTKKQPLHENVKLFMSLQVKKLNLKCPCPCQFLYSEAQSANSLEELKIYRRTALDNHCHSVLAHTVSLTNPKDKLCSFKRKI